MKKQQGFTLIELLTVVLVIGILAAIAIPNYSNYTKRAKISEALVMSAAAREAIADYYLHVGSLPIDNFAAGISAPKDLSGKHIDSMSIENGAIHLRFSNADPELAGKYLSLRPVIVKNSITAPIYFICGFAKKNNDKQVVHGNNKTDIHTNWLLSSCNDR